MSTGPKMIIREYNAETGETIERDATKEELANRKADQEKFAAALKAAKEAEERKNAILEALASTTGFTTDEIRQALNA